MVTTVIYCVPLYCCDPIDVLLIPLHFGRCHCLRFVDCRCWILNHLLFISVCFLFFSLFSIIFLFSQIRFLSVYCLYIFYIINLVLTDICLQRHFQWKLYNYWCEINEKNGLLMFNTCVGHNHAGFFYQGTGGVD